VRLQKRNLNRLVKVLKQIVTKVLTMAIYLTRNCPNCKNFLDIAISRVSGGENTLAVSAVCICCGYKLDWKLIRGVLQKAFARDPVHQRMRGCRYSCGPELPPMRREHHPVLLLIKPGG
jgi:hypothetical protein